MMHSGTVLQSKSLLNMPKNPIHPQPEKSHRVSSAAEIQHFEEQSSGAEKKKCYFRVFFKAVIFFFFFLKTNKRAHRACLRKNNTTTLQEGGTLTQRRRFRSEYSLLLQHGLKRNLIIRNLSNLYNLFRGRFLPPSI